MYALKCVCILAVLCSSMGMGMAQMANFRPDLRALEDSLLISTVDLDNPSVVDQATIQCLVREGCVSSATGVHTLLRFTTKIDNIGDADFAIGVPPEQRIDRGPWHWDTCHGHWHVKGYASYELRPKEMHIGPWPCHWANGRLVPQELRGRAPAIAGRKNGFCLMDLAEIVSGDNQCGFRKHCCDQGISAGCADIYNNQLQCQWIDITGVNIDDEVEYELHVHVNPEGTMEESDLTDNLAVVDVRLNEITRDPSTQFILNPAPDPGDCNN